MKRSHIVALISTALIVLVVAIVIFRPGGDEPGPQDSFSFHANPLNSLEIWLDAAELSAPTTGEYMWDFGDGTTGSSRDVKLFHEYEQAGEYRVRLTIAGEKEPQVVEETVQVRAPEQFAEMFGEIEPADGAELSGPEAWVRWDSYTDAGGRVLWHQVGEAEVHTAEVEVGDADDLNRAIAGISGIAARETYEYVIEETVSEVTQRSGLRTFSVIDAVKFDPPLVTADIDRGYDQIVPLKLVNGSSEPITVAARAVKQLFELPADVIGPGSAESPVELQAGEALELQLAVTSTDAERGSYEIPIEAAGATAVARVIINATNFKLSVREIDEAANPFTLAKLIEVTNEGDSLTNLAISIAPPHDSTLRLNPAGSHIFLKKGDSLRFTATPALSLDFKELKAVLVLSAAGPPMRFPLTFAPPPGTRLFGIRTGSHDVGPTALVGAGDSSFILWQDGTDGASQESADSEDSYCQNRPATGACIPAPPGTGPGGDNRVDPNEVGLVALQGQRGRDTRGNAPGSPPRSPCQSCAPFCGKSEHDDWVAAMRAELLQALGHAMSGSPGRKILGKCMLIQQYDKYIRDTSETAQPCRQDTDGAIQKEMLRIWAYIKHVDATDPKTGSRCTENALAPATDKPLWFAAITRDRSPFSDSLQTVAVQAPEFNWWLPEQRCRDRLRWLNGHNGPLARQAIYGDSVEVLQSANANGNVFVIGYDGAVGATVDGLGEEVGGFEHLTWTRGRPAVSIGARSALVGWSTGDESACRVFEDGKWSDELAVPGGDVDVTIGSRENLYAATTSGLFALRGDALETVESREMQEPAVATDADGNPIVAWVQDDMVYFQGSQVAAGSQPALVVDPEGVIVLAYLSGENIVVRRREGEDWSPEDRIHAPGAQNPTLALGPEKVRLSFVAPCEAGPDALWLVQLPETEPILVPAITGNVSDAWLTMEFHSGAGTHGHDTDLTFNTMPIAEFSETRLDGRYLFRLEPQQVIVSPDQPTLNHVGMYTWAINRGHYRGMRKFRLTVRKAWDEHFVFARTEEEARQAVQDLYLRQEEPREGLRRTRNRGEADLALFSNRVNLPDAIPDSGAVDLPVDVVNLGLATAGAAKLVMRYGGEQVDVAEIPALESDETYSVTVRLTSQEQAVTFKIQPSTPDFDSSNDKLKLALWDAYQWESWEGRTGGTAQSESRHELRPVVNDVRPYWVENGLPEHAAPSGPEPWIWDEERTLGRFSSHFAPPPPNGGRSLHYFLDAADSLPLAPGDNLIQYVYLDADNPPQQILLRGYYDGKHEGQGVYWGGVEEDDRILVGGEVANRLGDLPETGTWVRLKIPVSELGIENGWFDGLLFGTYGGTARWGPTTKSIERLDPSPSIMIVDDAGQAIGGAN